MKPHDFVHMLIKKLTLLTVNLLTKKLTPKLKLLTVIQLILDKCNGN